MAKLDNKKERKILVKIVCFVASFILWLYVANTQNPEVPKNISVPVEIENVNSLSNLKLVLLQKSKYYATIKVKGPVLEINRIHASDFKLKADLSLYALKKGINYIPVEVVDQPDNVVITEPRSITVQVNVDELVEKSVPIKVNIPVKEKYGYKTSDPVPKQTSAYVSGPSQYVKNVDHVTAQMKTRSNVDKDVEVNVALKAYDAADRLVDGVEINPKSVDVVIPVNEVKSVPINIKTKGNLRNNIAIKSMVAQPSKIAIVGSKADLAAISSIDTEPIDLSSITGDKSLYAKLKLPSNITTLSDSNAVKIAVQVNNIHQKNITCNISFNNLAKGYTYKADKMQVSLVLLGDESIVDNIKSSDIKCTVDLKSLGDGVHTIPVNITIPDGVEVSSYTPKKVRVTISKISTGSNKGSGDNNNTGTNTGDETQ